MNPALLTKTAENIKVWTAWMLARKIVKALEEQGYLIKVEPIKHNVGTCYRCKTVVEPRVSKQWFVKWNRWQSLR